MRCLRNSTVRREIGQYIHTQYFNCSVVLGGFTSAKGHESTLIFKVNSSLQEVVEIIDIK